MWITISHVIVATHLYPSAVEEPIPLHDMSDKAGHLAIEICYPQAVAICALIGSAKMARIGDSSVDSSIGVVITTTMGVWETPLFSLDLWKSFARLFSLT